MYDYLKKFVNASPDDPNYFAPVAAEEIAAAEKALHFSLPAQLAAFYHEVGCGFLTMPEGGNPADPEWSYYINRIVPPLEVVGLFRGKDANAPSEGYPDGFLPFFDLGESAFFLLKINDAEDHAVYWPSGKKTVAPSLPAFFQLLSANPSFYTE